MLLASAANAAAPLADPQFAGQAMAWTPVGAAAATLFFSEGGTGVARDDAGVDAPLTWSIENGERLCIAVAAASPSCGALEAPPAASPVNFLGADGASLGQLAALGTFTSLSLTIIDGAGADGPGAFLASSADGALVGRTQASEAAVLVLPGRYTVEPAIDPLAPVEVEAAAGAPAAARLTRQDGLWLTFSRAKQDETCCERWRVLGLLRPQGEREAIVAAWREPAIVDPASRAEPRSAATPDEIAAALAAARAWIAGDAIRATRENTDYAWLSRALAEAILIAYGEAADVDRLFAYETAVDTWSAPQAAAALEARLGAIGGGGLAELAKSGDPAKAVPAMAALANEGDRRWDQALAEAVGTAPWPLVRQALVALRGAPRPIALAAAHAFIAREALDAAAAEKEADPAKRVYPLGRGLETPILLTSDDPADLKAAAENEVWADSTAGVAIAPLFANPEIFVQPADPAGLDDSLADLICGVVSGLGPDDAAGAYDAMAARYIDGAYRALIAGGEIDGRADYQSRARFAIFTGACAPSETLAAYIEQGWGGNLAVPPIAETWHEAEILDYLAKGTLGWTYYSQLDFIDHEKVRAALAAAPAEFKAAPLLEAFHRVLRFGTVRGAAGDAYARRETRPYVMRMATADRYGGTLSGLLRLDVTRTAGDVALTLTPDHRIAYADFCSLAAKIATDCDQTQWLVDPYSKDAGALIAAVRLAGPGGDVALTPRDAPEGARRYAAAGLPAGLPGLTLFVTLSIAGVEGAQPDTRLEIAFPLTRTPLARRERGEPP